MGRQNVYLHALNAGVMDKDKLTRIDLSKMRMASEIQDNFIPDTSGKAFFRPGFRHLAASAVQADGWLMPFARSATEAEVLEFTNLSMRVWSETAQITRASVTSAVTSGDFSSGTGWTLSGTGGATSVVSGGVLTLNANSIGGRATAVQQVTTSSGGIEHAFQIVVTRGPVSFKCGSSSGFEDYISATTLRTGTHSLTFTPAGSYWVEFYSESTVNRIVDSITIEGAGAVSIPTPWPLAALPCLRVAQSIDVLFVACDGYWPQRIERRKNGRSWSVVRYDVDDGPFTAGRTSDVKIQPSGTFGNITLTSDNPFFNSEHVGATLRLFHGNSLFSENISGDASSTTPVRMSGIYRDSLSQSDRYVTFTYSGTWSGSISRERSVDSDDTGYHEFSTSTGNGVADLNDVDSNVVKWYRSSFRSGNYTSGAASVTSTYDGSGGDGIVRITGVNSSVSANAEVLQTIRSAKYTSDWSLGEFGAAAGQALPAAVALFDGRLWWFGRDRFWGSISDAFDSFSSEQEGDAAPIARSIASGGVNNVKWALPLQRLIIGTDGAEVSARSSSLDEPLTASNITVRDASTVGSANVQAVRIDSRGIFVDRPGTTLFELMYDSSSYDYTSAKLSKLSSSLFTSGVKQLAVMRRPETRVLAVMNDGTINMVVYEPQQEVAAFIPIKTRSGDFFKSVAVIPGVAQDRIYARVLRNLNGSDVYTIERMALDTEAVPNAYCRCLDSYVSGINAPASATITGLSHLNGEAVYVWGDSAAYGPFTVSGGSITLPVAVTDYVVGLRYRGRLKTARQAYAASAGTPMLQPGRIDHAGFLMNNFHKDGIAFGPEFDNPDRPLDQLPAIDGSFAEREDIVLDEVNDEITIPMDGPWMMSPRVCLEVNSPYPAHILGLVLTITTNDRI